MISGLEHLIRLVGEYEQIIENADPHDETEAEDRFEQRDLIERKLLLTPVESIGDAVAKLNYLARIAEDGERSDGADVECIRDLAAWMDARFGMNSEGGLTERLESDGRRARS